MKKVLIDGSRIIIEAAAKAGVEAYAGYPITPANLLYLYASRRFPIFLPAPDEITAIQWLLGLSSTGKIPITATSFPGFALMLESINMAYMMELAIVIILAQRLGPSTGSATTGAEGDISLVAGCISGGYHIPVFCLSSLEDCWNITKEAVYTAVNSRTPVILLTSKEMIMTSRSFDLSKLPEIEPVKQRFYEKKEKYIPYKAGINLVPDFLDVGNSKHQVRLTASTHDREGMLKKDNKEALDNTARIHEKIIKNTPVYYELNEEKSETIIVSFGISTYSSRDAVNSIRAKGKKISLLIPKTLLPVSSEIIKILDKYERVIIVEENLNGSYCDLLFDTKLREGIKKVNAIGKMIKPEEIIKKVNE